MKTTKAQFESFKESFLYWQKELGMMDYRVAFEHVHLGKSYATIGVDHHGRGVVVSMTTDLDDATVVDVEGFDPAAHGKHEAIHLFLERLSSLAHSRFLLEREIYDAEEGMVRVLEKVLVRKEPCTPKILTT